MQILAKTHQKVVKTLVSYSLFDWKTLTFNVQLIIPSDLNKFKPLFQPPATLQLGSSHRRQPGSHLQHRGHLSGLSLRLHQLTGRTSLRLRRLGLRLLRCPDCLDHRAVLRRQDGGGQRRRQRLHLPQGDGRRLRFVPVRLRRRLHRRHHHFILMICFVVLMTRDNVARIFVTSRASFLECSCIFLYRNLFFSSHCGSSMSCCPIIRHNSLG